MIRPHDELELEHIREDLASMKQQNTSKFSWQGGANQKHDKFLAYQPFVAKVVINDVQYVAHQAIENKADAERVYEARSEIVRLRAIDLERFVEK